MGFLNFIGELEKISITSDITLLDIFYTFIVLLFGLILAKIIAKISRRTVERKINTNTAKIVHNIVLYTSVFVVILIVLKMLHLKVTGLLAAAGFTGIVVGFAARSSFSNIISGVFLFIDRPFKVGDVVDIDGSFGIVMDISLLSTRIRTFDNVYVRIPNEKVFNSTIKNMSKFNIRRIDVETGIAYKEDIEKAKNVILEFAESSEYVLTEPEPQVIVKELSDSSVNLILRCWIESANYVEALSSLTEGVKKALDNAGIEIPFPQRVVYIRKD